MPEPSLFSFLLHLHSFQTLLSNKALWVFFLCLIGLMGWIAWCDWSYSISFCYVSSFSMGEVLLVSSDSVCGVLGWGNWVFRLVFEGEAIQRISKYKSFFFSVSSYSVLRWSTRWNGPWLFASASRRRGFWQRGTGCQLSLSNMRSSGIGSTCWHSWALSSVGPLLQLGAHSVLPCSMFHYVIMLYFLNSEKFLHLPCSYKLFSKFVWNDFFFFWISFIHLSLLFFFVENVRYRFEVREFASSGFCATIGPKLISPSLKDTREIQRWERDPVPGSRAVKNRIQMIRSPMKESIT